MTDTSRGLTIRYADGKVSTRPLTSTGGMWTPEFPRISGVDTARDGVPLTTLDVKHVVEGTDVVVTVSLFYGGPYKNGVKVATVRVPPAIPVEVTELRSYGVEPITLSLVSIPNTHAPAAHGSSASPYLEVRAQPVGPNASAYRVTVKNTSPFPLMWFHFEAYRADGSPISGRKRGMRNLPLVLPNGEYSFELPLSTRGESAGDDPGAWQPLERVEVTSLMWLDGEVEGDHEPAMQQRALDISRADQIRAILKILRGAPRPSIASLREQVAEVVTGSDVESQQARDEVRAQLDSFARRQQSPVLISRPG